MNGLHNVWTAAVLGVLDHFYRATIIQPTTDWTQVCNDVSMFQVFTRIHKLGRNLSLLRLVRAQLSFEDHV